ncbi:MAG: putative porin [Deltaproteobacteria bacterium]|nr:putative porin [Deltaproteobacteria bacterium]
MAIVAFAGARRYIRKGILAILPLIFFGCATVPRPVTIKHERAPSRTDAAVPDQQYRKESDGQSVAALVDLLKRKNMISADEAARFTEQSVTRAAGEKGAAVASETNDKELTEKIKRSVTEELMKGLQEQIKKQVQEELPGEIKESEKERTEKITTSVTEELKKSLQEQVRREVQEELPREIKKVELAAAAPEWTRRIRFGGDIRLRYESDRFDKNNGDFAQPANPTQLMNTKIDQDYYRYRVRFGAEAQVNEQVDAVIRLSTGNTSNPVSTNTTLNDYMNKDSVLFDLAYLKWQPREFLTIYGGRMPNPWFSSDLVWDRDLNFEGLALSVRKPITESWVPFLTVGAFPLQQYDFSRKSKWLTAGQLGLERKSRKGIGARVGASYYNFRNITGVLNNPLNPGATDWTAPQFQQKGNTLFNISADPAVYKTALASEFKEFNLTGTLDIGLWDPYHIVLLGDYVKNLGFDKSDVARRTGNPNQPKQTAGYKIGMSVGYPTIQEAGQWKAYLHYRRLEADAVADAFTDSDFHLGGTNARGWILGGDYALSKNFWLTLRWLTANEISGPPLAIDVLQVDFTARF